MAFTAQDVMKLREKTGVGMMDCKKALTECGGNAEKAAEWLREKGLAAASKKESRIAAEGIVSSYIHLGGKIGVLVEINCETDFAAKNVKFQELAKDIAMQIAAAKPLYVRSSEVPADVLDKEKAILLAQAKNEGKPEAVAVKMVEGRIKKYYKENCLMDMEFIKDNTKTITDVVNEAILVIGEKITVRRFTRYEMGEGLEKRSDNLAEEVQKQMEGK